MSFFFSENFDKITRQIYKNGFFRRNFKFKGIFLSIKLDPMLFSASRDFFSGSPAQAVQELWLIIESKAQIAAGAGLRGLTVMKLSKAVLSTGLAATNDKDCR